MTEMGRSLLDTSLYDLEFRCPEDDAWYSARVVLEGDTLTVSYWTFPKSPDLKVNPNDFLTADSLADFCRKFRPVSQPLQDSHCSRLIEGMTVCASHTSEGDDIRFFDATVETVHHEKHSVSVVNDDEECLCTFVLAWLHGPSRGNLTSTSIEHICVIKSPGQVDPKVASFAKLVNEKFMITPKSNSDCESGLPLGIELTYDRDNCGQNVKSPSHSQYQHCSAGMGSPRQFVNVLCTTRGRDINCNQQNGPNDHDTDMGGETYRMNSSKGVEDRHFILIDNLEKDLSPSSIEHFIQKHTNILPQSFVYPTLSPESYARGAIMLDCKTNLRKIFEFIENPALIIISSRGKPWVGVYRRLMHGSFFTTMGSFLENCKSEFQEREPMDDLKVVYSGTEQYRIAQEKKKLFMRFMDHQYRIHDRLALEERKITLTTSTL